MLNAAKNTLKTILGILLVLIGIIGGFIPIFQGWVFGIPGLILLSSVFPPIQKWLDHFREKAHLKKSLK